MGTADEAAEQIERLSCTGQPKITGYRELSAQEIALINVLKDRSDDVGRLVETLERNPMGLDLDARWVAIAKTHLQQGFMTLVRAVAKPTSF